MQSQMTVKYHKFIERIFKKNSITRFQRFKKKKRLCTTNSAQLRQFQRGAYYAQEKRGSQETKSSC